MKIENQTLSRIVRAITGAKPETTEVEATAVEALAPAAVVDAVVEAVEAVAEAVEANVEAVVEQAVESLALTIDASAIQAELATVTEQLTGLIAALAEMTSKYEGAHAALTALAAEKEVMLAAQAAAKLAVRQTRVEAAIGTEKAAGLMAATEGLQDAQFDAVINALAGSVEAEAMTDLFQEVGVTAEADATQIVEESAEMRLLKQTYGAK